MASGKQNAEKSDPRAENEVAYRTPKALQLLSCFCQITKRDGWVQEEILATNICENIFCIGINVSLSGKDK